MMQARNARAIALFALIILSLASIGAQVYRNTVNEPFGAVSNGPQNLIVVDIDRVGRSPEAIDNLIRQRVAQVTRAQIQGARPLIQFYKRMGLLPEAYQLPILHTVVLRRNGQLLYPTRTRNGGLGNGQLTFQIVDGENPFPPNYKNLLQVVLNRVPSLVEAEYGKPARTLTIQVVNYDDAIGDRDAVVGGIYDVSNNRFLFPVYNSAEAAAVNLLHLVVLAFHADVGFAFDAWEEGFARAVTTRIARGAGFRSIPGLEPPYIDLTLDNTYDVRPYYDAWNQPTLGSPSFIAPSLRQLPVPGGTTGGLWLVRYQMAGSVWLKLAVEYPSFFREFNARYYQSYTPTLRGNTTALLNLAKQTLQAISGNPNPTVEGIPFEQWVRRQFILDTSVTYGRKLHAQMFPYVSEVSPDEQAVFPVFLTYFQTLRTGTSWDEALLNGTCYPIYWDYSLQRLTLSPQYERVDIRVGTGTVVPSFVGAEYANQRLTVDFSVGTEYAQVVYPSSKVQGTNFRNNFFGVVHGLDNGRVSIQIGTTLLETPLTKGAFGVRFPDEVMAREQIAVLTFFNTRGEQVGQVRVNTGLEFQYVRVFLQSTESRLTFTLPAGLSMVSFPLRPFETDMARLLGIPADQLRLATWRQERFDYVYYPATPPPAPGVGYFLGLNNARTVTVDGVPPPQDRPFAIALQPGWNLIGMPFNTSVPVGSLQVVHQFDAPVSWETATTSIGSEPALVGANVFTLSTTGTYARATQLEPGKAYWVRVLRPEGVTLLVPPPTSTTGGRSESSRSESRPLWSMELSLQSPRGGAILTIGLDPAGRTRAAALNAEMPPLLPDMMGFGSRTPSGTLLLTDIRPASGRQTWELEVAPAEPNTEHTLTWQLPSNTARRWRLVLENPTTGERVDMRQQTFYRLTPSERQTLRIVLDPTPQSALRILNLQVSASRGNAITVHYTLTADATVRAEIRSARGETLRVLQPGRATRSGSQSLVWNGRDAQERVLPPGTYQLHIQATDSEGRTVRAFTPIILTR